MVKYCCVQNNHVNGYTNGSRCVNSHEYIAHYPVRIIDHCVVLLRTAVFRDRLRAKARVLALVHIDSKCAQWSCPMFSALWNVIVGCYRVLLQLATLDHQCSAYDLVCRVSSRVSWVLFSYQAIA